MFHRIRPLARLGGLMILAALGGCAVCKSTDNAEQCRTKQRDHGQVKTGFAASFERADRSRDAPATGCKS